MLRTSAFNSRPNSPTTSQSRVRLGCNKNFGANDRVIPPCSRYLVTMQSRWLAALIVTVACGRTADREPSGSAACGLASLAGPTALLGQFSIPEQTLASPPRNLPERLVRSE